MTFSLEDLREIRDGSVSANPVTGPDDVSDWLRSVDVDPPIWSLFLEGIEKGLLDLLENELKEEVPMDVLIGAIYSSGFEMGVRLQQAREAII